MTKAKNRSEDIPYRTFRSMLEENASRFPEKPFIESIDQGKRITHGQMYRVSNRISHFLKEKGIGANDRIVLLANNSLEYLILFLGVWGHGATFCPINVEINEKIIPELIRKIRPKMVVWDQELANLVPEQNDPWPWLALGTWTPEGGSARGKEDLFSMLQDYTDAPAGAPVCKEDDFSLIIHTSGTTSKPKGVLITYRTSFCSAEATALMIGMTEKDRILEYRPFSWGSAQSLGFMGPLYAGASSVVAKKFSRSRFFDWMKAHRITIAVGIPAAINMLLAERVAISKADLPDLRFITSSTAPLTVEQHLKFEETYGIKIVQLYGMSEAGWITANHPDNRKIGSVGRAPRHQALRIVDEAGGVCPTGTIGEIEVGGGQRAFGYLEEGSVLSPFGEGGLRTGDLGYLDEDGFLHITGRKKDLIIRGGINIAPLEIDNILSQHTEVADAATVGIPDEIYGQAIVCYVAGKAGNSLTKESVLTHCRARLPEYKMPQEIVFLDSIPRTEVGKVDRNSLLNHWMRHHPAR